MLSLSAWNTTALRMVVVGTAVSSVLAGTVAYIIFLRKHKIKKICYVSWPEANASNESMKEIVAVDCTHDLMPCLTHHRTPFNRSLEKIRGDTSTDIVLNALESSHPFLNTISHVTVNHFDVDAFTSVWALMHPEDALRYTRELRECAHIGDFRELGMM